MKAVVLSSKVVKRTNASKTLIGNQRISKQVINELWLALKSAFPSFVWNSLTQDKLINKSLQILYAVPGMKIAWTSKCPN